jgi:hypothetical protein
MAVNADAELKKRFLELLKVDDEFRFAVAGLLGLDTILSELKRLREDFLAFVKEQERRWEENERRWEENEKRWEGAYKRFEAIESELKMLWQAVEKLREDFLTFVKEQEKRWEEQERRWEENERRWEEAYKRFETIEKALLEHSKRLDDLSKAVAGLQVTFHRFSGRWGRDFERMVLEIFREVLEERGIVPGKVERFEYIDHDGRLYKKGSRIEMDVYIHDEKLYLIEVKAYAFYEDVEHFHNMAQIVEKIIGRKADKLMLIAVSISEDAWRRAQELGVDVICGAIVPL